MTWQTVARKDFEDVIRSWMLWAILGVFALMMGVVAIGSDTSGTAQSGSALVYDLFNTLGGELLIPLAALIVTYMAITGERESGSLRILFGLSHGRRSVFLGKLCSRLATMLFATVVLLSITAGVIFYIFGSIDLGLFVQFAGLTLLFSATFVGIALGISAMTGSRTRALGGVIGVYVLFMVIWDTLVAILFRVTQGHFPGLEAPTWYFLLQRLNPLTAYREALILLTDNYIWAMIGSSTLEDLSAEEATPEALMLTNRVGGDLPFYLTEWASVAVLLVWAIVPLAIGYWQFEAADLN